MVLSLPAWGLVTVTREDGGFGTGTCVLNGETLKVYLHVSHELAHSTTLVDQVTPLLQDLAVLERRARLWLENTSDETVGQFLAFHRNELKCEASLRDLRLHGVAIRPRPESFALVVDFKLHHVVSDQLLAVEVAPNGIPHAVSWES